MEELQTGRHSRAREVEQPWQRAAEIKWARTNCVALSRLSTWCISKLTFLLMIYDLYLSLSASHTRHIEIYLQDSSMYADIGHKAPSQAFWAFQSQRTIFGVLLFFDSFRYILCFGPGSLLLVLH